jgi:two-component system response regulator YesN
VYGCLYFKEQQALNFALQQAPDLILTDIYIPFMNGLELMEKLKENKLDCGIIILSGFEEFEYAQKAIGNGALAYLLKPINRRQLKETIAAAALKVRKARSARKYWEMLKKEVSEMERQFLKTLLHGQINDPAVIQDRIKKLGLSLQQRHNVVVIVRLDKYLSLAETMFPEELENLKKSIEDTAAMLLLIHSQFMGRLVRMSSEEWAFIISPYNSVENSVAKIRECCAQLAKELREKHSHTLSIGISRVCEELKDIGIAYKQAAEAAGIKFLPEASSVSLYDAVKPDDHREEVREAVKYIKNHYYEDITVEMVAKKLFISPSYLMHIFKDELGKTFNNYVVERRMEAAKELLVNSRQKIYVIAERLGYADVKYFCRVFKKMTGVSPGDYARSRYAGR